jgi:hypothetical protein
MLILIKIKKEEKDGYFIRKKNIFTQFVILYKKTMRSLLGKCYYTHLWRKKYEAKQ